MGLVLQEVYYIISANPHADDVNYSDATDLYICVAATHNQYYLSTIATNFSEDGGNIFSSISPRKNGKGFIISTAFPDRGYFVKDYYIMPTQHDNQWLIDQYVTKGYLTLENKDGLYVEQFYHCAHPQPKPILFTNDDIDLYENSYDDDNDKLTNCKVPTNYLVSANKSEILDQNFHQQQPSNYYIKGDKVQAIDQNDDWIKVSYKNGTKVGWVNKRDLSALR